eukprot:15450690-Alexandrium_andersonii.AAC.1
MCCFSRAVGAELQGEAWRRDPPPELGPLSDSDGDVGPGVVAPFTPTDDFEIQDAGRGIVAPFTPDPNGQPEEIAARDAGPVNVAPFTPPDPDGRGRSPEVDFWSIQCASNRR